MLALEEVAARLGAEPEERAGVSAQDRAPAPRVRHRVLLVCPKDFSNLPTASAVDVRKQRAVTARQLARLTRIEDIADALPEGTCFSPELPADELTAAVESVPATYAPECLSACELAFHCRARSRAAGAVTPLGRPAAGRAGRPGDGRGRPGGGPRRGGDPDDPAVAALRRAAALRAEALAPRRSGRPAVSLIATLARLEAVSTGRAQPAATVRHRHLVRPPAGVRAADHRR